MFAFAVMVFCAVVVCRSFVQAQDKGRPGVMQAQPAKAVPARPAPIAAKPQTVPAPAAQARPLPAQAQQIMQQVLAQKAVPAVAASAIAHAAPMTAATVAQQKPMGFSQDQLRELQRKFSEQTQKVQKMKQDAADLAQRLLVEQATLTTIQQQLAAATAAPAPAPVVSAAPVATAAPVAVQTVMQAQVPADSGVVPAQALAPMVDSGVVQNQAPAPMVDPNLVPASQTQAPAPMIDSNVVQQAPVDASAPVVMGDANVAPAAPVETAQAPAPIV